MKKQNWARRILPIILAAVLMIGIFPAAAAQPEEVVPVSAIVSEVISLREECVKHFLCEDGTYIVATYASPVHYKVNGEWKDIDNSLVISSASGKATYTTRASALPVSIPQDLSDGQQITVSNKGYTFGFGVSAEEQTVSLQSAATPVAVEELPSALASQREASQKKQGAQTAAERVREYNAEKMAVANLSSAVVYEGVFPGAVLEYIITPEGLKENFVVAEPRAEYVYRFNISMDGLVPMPQDDGSILLAAASKPEDVLFTLGAPYMYDANGMESRNVKMTLENGILTVSADAAWVNDKERAFPVVIDPSVFINTNSQTVIKDTYVSSWFGSANYIGSGRLYAGKTLLGELTRTYVKFNLPTIPSSADIIYAQFELTKVLTSANSVLDVRNLASKATWNPSTITWNDQPVSTVANSANSLPLVDSRNTTSGSNVYEFTITSTLRNWYNGSTNNGLVITTPNESNTGQVDLCSSRSASTAQRPVLWFAYNFSYTRNYSVIANTTTNLATVRGYVNYAATVLASNFGIILVEQGSGQQKPTLNPKASCPRGSSACDSSCGTVSNCRTLHHKSANYLLQDVDWSNGPTAVIRFVDFSLCCYTLDGNNNYVHYSGNIGGAALKPYNCLVTTLSSSPGFPQLATVHEISHLFGAPDYGCTSGQLCVMTYGSNVNNAWCDNCRAAINQYIQ